MTSHRIAGGGGTWLHAVEMGNPRGRPILFLHGFSQCWLTWRRQLDSDLAADFRLVAPDLRGHGLSDRPRDGYTESRLWAEDIHAVIDALHLEQPILCAWSYGIVALDYIRHYGDEALGGLHLVGAITKLGSDDALSVLTPECLRLVPGVLATDAEEIVSSLEAFVRLFYAQAPGAEELYLVLGYNFSVPPFVRQAMFSRVVDNDDLLPQIRTPVLLTHGALDAVVSPVAVERHKALVAHAQLHVMPDAGHAAFWDDAATFNRCLRAFAERV